MHLDKIIVMFVDLYFGHVCFCRGHHVKRDNKFAVLTHLSQSCISVDLAIAL